MSLWPIGETSDPTLLPSTELVFDFDRTTYKHFIEHFHKTDSEEVSDREHIDFLTYFLYRVVFGSIFLQVDKKFIISAIQIHGGRKINLNKLILGSLYEAFGLATSYFKYTTDPQYKFHINGPIWLPQLWLNAKFESFLKFKNHYTLPQQVKGRWVEATRLALLTP